MSQNTKRLASLIGKRNAVWCPSRRFGVANIYSYNTTTIRSSSSQSSNKDASNGSSGLKSKLKADGLTLSHFIAKSSGVDLDHRVSSGGAVSTANQDGPPNIIPAPADIGDEFNDIDMMVTDAMSCSTHPGGEKSNSLDQLKHQFLLHNEEAPTVKFHIKTYGCQMNVNDTDIVRSILLNHNNKQEEEADDNSPNLRFIETNDEIQADLLLTNTCAIRENAEQKVWNSCLLYNYLFATRNV